MLIEKKKKNLDCVPPHLVNWSLWLFFKSLWNKKSVIVWVWYLASKLARRKLAERTVHNLENASSESVVLLTTAVGEGPASRPHLTLL